MTGLEKITERIITDAQEDARKIIDAADAECEKIKAGYDAKRAELEARYSDKTDEECANIILRAKSSSDMSCRNIMLAGKAELIDAAFSRALDDIYSMNKDKYGELLVSLLKTALKNQTESEKESMRLYGEDIAPEKYEIILSKKDRDAYGESVLNGLRQNASSKLTPQTVEKTVLSDKTADIGGGLILKCGDVEINCSIAMILTEMRSELEPEVRKILFRDGENAADGTRQAR